MTRAHRTNGHVLRRLRARARRTYDICWLCGAPIDKDLAYPHPGSFTIDHVVPVAIDPSLAYSWDNIRAAHASCNIRRQTGRVASGRPSTDW